MEYREIDEMVKPDEILGQYKELNEEGDWTKSLEVGLENILVKFNWGSGVRERGEKIIDIIKEDHRFSGLSRIGILGGVVYVASILEGHPLTHRGIKNKTGISTQTIQERKNDILEAMGKDIGEFDTKVKKLTNSRSKDEIYG